jgi:hypothetical protein
MLPNYKHPIPQREARLRIIRDFAPSKMTADNWSHEETDDPLHADRHNFYKVEKWSKDGQRVEEMLFAGNSLAKAQRIFERFISKGPRSRLTIRQQRACCRSDLHLRREVNNASGLVILR